MQGRNFVAQDAAGNLLSSGTVEVRDHRTQVLVPIYASDDTGDPLDNPFNIGIDGGVLIFARDGVNDVTFKSGMESRVFESEQWLSAPNLIANVAQLRTATAMTLSGSVAELFSYYNAFGMLPDGGGGTIYLDTSDTTSDDNGCTIFVDADDRRWKRPDLNTATAKQCGCKTDGTDNTERYAAAVAALSMLVMESDPNPYLGYMLINRDNFSLVGYGSASTTMKATSGAARNVVEIVSDSSLDANDPLVVPLEHITVCGLTLDGNKDGSTQPNDDLDGWGLPIAKTSYVNVYDVVAKNCWLGGVGVFINANYCDIEATVIDCGVVGSVTLGPEPGFDVNSSKYSHYRFITKGCGARVLDNCFHNQVQGIIVDNPGTHGFVFTNQLVNESHGNTINVTISGGCSTVGAVVGANCRGNEVNVIADSIVGFAFEIQGESSGGIPLANVPTGNDIKVISRNCQYQAAIVRGNGNTIGVTSYQDNLNAAAYGFFAVDVDGIGNTLSVNVQDGAVFQTKALALRAAAADNVVASYTAAGNATIAVSGYSDAGTGNTGPAGRGFDGPGFGYGSSGNVGGTGGAGGFTLELVTAAITAGEVDIDCKTGNEFDITDTGGVAFTINAPTHEKTGKRITLTLRNGSGGAMGAITWDGIYKMAAWVNPADGYSRSIDFKYNGASWIEISRTPADVPN